MLCTKFGKIWNSGSREKINYVEMLQTVGRADRQTDSSDRRAEDGLNAIRKAHLNLQWAKK